MIATEITHVRVNNYDPLLFVVIYIMVDILCFQTVKEQFSDKEYDLNLTAVTFSDDSDPFMSIDFEKEVDGWIFKLRGGDKVQKIRL